ncbi:hypothetical protein JQ616_37435 [Bradyrhizobium tropiciagri]|uniref:hypothetical protein n=1 Tax=Bradyrhizobium tropiciagri TaxID=312253 RepID=UPI001BAC9F72|nr:hypothetical protein [Bradyrhizobium tropiciagri]MBR0900669.1 hypothetical protein [Bradyrhizobium tropiciagri]
MKPQLSLLFIGSAVLSVVLAVACDWFFPDVLPLASTEPPHASWRLDAAFVLTTITWTTTFVSAASGLALFLRYVNDAAKLEERQARVDR